MSTRLDENLGAVGFDNLINGTCPPAEAASRKVKAGQGVLKRGSVLAASGEGYELLKEALTETDAPVVLADDIDTGATEGEAVIATAYRSGHFNTNSLIVADGYEITTADKDVLRAYGILVSDAVEI